MIRISGVVLDFNKHLVIALRKVFGVGKMNSYYICKKSGVSPFLKVRELSELDVLEIQKSVSKFETEGVLRTKIKINIKRLRDIKCYRGVRHKLSLPVRGQRTKTNAKTRKKTKKK